MANDNNFLNPRRPFFNLPFSTYHNYYRLHLRKNSNCLQGVLQSETNLKFSFSLTRKKERRERENEKEKIRESSKRRKKEEKSV